MFTVCVIGYRLHPRVDVHDTVRVFESKHRSPKQAARVLASLISERTEKAKRISRQLPSGYGGRYLIEHDGTQHALVPFRKAFCQ